MGGCGTVIGFPPAQPDDELCCRLAPMPASEASGWPDHALGQPLALGRQASSRPPCDGSEPLNTAMTLCDRQRMHHAAIDHQLVLAHAAKRLEPRAIDHLLRSRSW